MIKFTHRQNLKYPLLLLLWNVLLDVHGILVSHFFNVSGLSINLPLMFLGEFLAGSLIYLYQYKFYLSKKKGNSEFMGIKLIRAKQNLAKDSNKKIFFLIFCAAFFDFIEFKLFSVTSKFFYISQSLESRLKGLYTIFNALFYYFVLRLSIFRHQIISLLVIIICIIIVVCTEFIFQKIDIFLTYNQFALLLFFILLIHFYSASIESVGKYLFEFNYLNPFYELMFEGLFGFVISFIYCYIYNPFNEIIEYRNTHSKSNFIFLILSLILYLILNGLKNSYRVLTTKIFSPMTTTFMRYIANPLYLIYYFIAGIDFNPFGNRNYLYFIINLIVSMILTLCGLVYNEFIVLFFCKLEKETHNQIVKRAIIENELSVINGQTDDETEISS